MQRLFSENPVQQEKLTSLQLAVRQGNLNLVLKALKNGNSPNEITQKDWDALKAADDHPIWIYNAIETSIPRQYDGRRYKYEVNDRYSLFGSELQAQYSQDPEARNESLVQFQSRKKCYKKYKPNFP